MLPYINIFGRIIPMYGLLSMTGALLGMLYIILRAKSLGIDREDAVYIYVIGAIGVIIGAKLFYLITVFPQMCSDIFAGISLSDFAARYIAGGMVFYGGLAGGVAGALIYCRALKVRLTDYAPVLVPAFALAHAVSRVGCFCAGCCYGVRTDAAWGVVIENEFVSTGGPVVPIQLVEAAGELCIFLFLLWFTSSEKRRSHTLFAYLALYAPMRFVLEFFRGDAARGRFWLFSTSQWISLLIIAVLIAYSVLRKRKNRKNIA